MGNTHQEADKPYPHECLSGATSRGQTMESVMRSAEAMIWVRLEQRNVSTSLPPVHVSGHLRVTGGMINDTSHGSEGEVWRVGAYLWGHHRHDRRLHRRRDLNGLPNGIANIFGTQLYRSRPSCRQ